MPDPFSLSSTVPVPVWLLIALLMALGTSVAILFTRLKRRPDRRMADSQMSDRIAKAAERLGATQAIPPPAPVSANHPPQAHPLRPDLHTRIAALLTLERIAQDSTEHDNGRDHVRVMELLCAYIRETAGTTDAPPGTASPGPETTAPGLASPAAPAPRQDIAVALRILGRRSPAQLRVEAAWPGTPDATTDAPFTRSCPALPDPPRNRPLTRSEVAAFKDTLDQWLKAVRGDTGYRLDLRATNLQAADLSGDNFRGARFDKARMEGAILTQTRLEGANFSGTYLASARLANAQLQGATLTAARLPGADLRHASLQGADLSHAALKDADLSEARLEGATLTRARLHGATLRQARLEGADLLYAQIPQADLRQARLEAARLAHAQLQGATLIQARLEGASLQEAQLHGADLTRAQLDQHTDLNAADLHGAALRGMDLSTTGLSADQAAHSFADRSVILPEALARPARWPDWTLRDSQTDDTPSFRDEWRRFQADPDTYVPPAKPSA